jgi:AP-1 complex subunit mu
MRVYLSGMPELRLGLNDKVLFETTGRTCFVYTIDNQISLCNIVLTFRFSCFSGTKNKGVELEDVKFHQCVRLSRFENDRTISFVPPDGEFELMSYRLNTQVSVRCFC